MNSKHLTASIRKAAGKASTFVATITTDSVDRDGEVVVPAGMNSKDYERNPVLLYEHDVLKPIGKMLKMKRGDRSIEAEFALAPRPEGHTGDWLPDAVGALMDFGALNTMSIGFLGLEARPASKADSEKYGQGVRRVYGKWKLLEVSVVSIPANQDAIITAVRKGLCSPAVAKRFGVTVPDAPAPIRRSYRVSVAVPALGDLDRVQIVRDEMARARGRLYAD
jgi:HK97 family phage prohead protease